MFKKIILIVSVIIILVLVIASAGIYWALGKINSPEFKHFIETKISATTGIDVEFEKLHIGLSNAEVTNLTIPAKDALGDENFLQVKGIKVHYNILKLFNSPLTIDKIEIEDPILIARQNASGSLILPIEKAPATAAKIESKERTFISLPEIYLRNANLSIFASDQSLLFSAAQSYAQASYAKLGNGQEVNANLSVKKIFITPGLNLGDFTAPIVYKGNRLTVDKIQSVFYGGNLSGSASLDLGVAPSAFNTNITVSGADLGGLLGNLGASPDTIGGKFDLNFNGNGNLDSPKNLTGSGDLIIPSPVIGKLKAYQNITQIIGTIGGISVLKEGKFDNIKTMFTISEQKLQLNPLAVNSPNLTISLGGAVGFDQNLDLKGEVILAPGILQVAQTVENILNTVNTISHPDTPPATAPQTPGMLKFPLTVSGPATDPKIGLDINSTLPNQQEKTSNIINGLSNLFNKKTAPAPANDSPAPAN
ncbi:MAG: AsmA-like C-terminal region-containing protein [Verrucomicrobiales bacterium]|jgi:hypothetical protein|nr:AsmA-like C-terminal region-containing protein [Verrucomicrobiales bacterium]